MAMRKKKTKAARSMDIKRLRGLLKKAKGRAKSLKAGFRAAREISRDLKKQLRAAEKAAKLEGVPAAKAQAKATAGSSARRGERGTAAPSPAKTKPEVATQKRKIKLRPLKPKSRIAPPTASLPVTREPAAEADAPAPDQ